MLHASVSCDNHVRMSSAQLLVYVLVCYPLERGMIVEAEVAGVENVIGFSGLGKLIERA